MIAELITGKNKHTFKIDNEVVEIGHNKKITLDITVGEVTNTLTLETFNNSGITISLRNIPILSTDKVSYIKGYRFTIYNFMNLTLEVDPRKISVIK